MRYVVLLLVTVSLALAAVRVSAQTPDDATATPEPTELAAPSPEPTATPIAAASDEIVFTGELAVPAGTTVHALFEGVTSATCATVMTEEVTLDVSSFVLRVPAPCAEHRIGPTICWSDTGCYMNLAGGRICDFSRGGCGWSDIVAPGKVVAFGSIPIAGPDEVIVIGQVPVPAGATVTLGFLDVEELQRVICGSVTSEEASDPHSSSFTIHADASCSGPGRDLPHICWREPPCHVIWFDNPLMRFPGAGTTIALAPFLDENDPNATPTPRPGIPSVGGGEPLLPPVGNGEGDRSTGKTLGMVMVALMASFGCLAVGAVAFVGPSYQALIAPPPPPWYPDLARGIGAHRRSQADRTRNPPEAER